MPISIGINAVTPTTVTLALTGLEADGTIDVQFSINPDFEYCVCPILLQVPRATPAQFDSLNQSTTYFVRARSRRASGTLSAWSDIATFRTPESAPQDTAPAAVMIEPALIVVPNHVLEFSCPTAMSGSPASNLGKDSPVPLRAMMAANTCTINARMGPDPVDTIALLMTNLPEAATVQFMAGPTSAVASYTSPVFPFRASPNVPGRPGYHGLFRLPEAVSFPFWRAIITVAAPLPHNVLHVEHMIFGRNRTTRNHSTDKSESGLDLGSVDRSRSGVPNRVTGYKMRRVEFELSGLTEAQYETQFGDFVWRVGGTTPILVAPNSKAGAFLHDRLLYGVVTAGRVVNPASPRYTRSFTIDSLI